MLLATRGLVFHVSRYSDSSGIVKIFTEDYGLQSFIVKSLFSRSSRIKPALFGHLSLIDIVYNNKPGHSLQYLKEVSLHKDFDVITDNIGRSSVMLFINEVLYKTVREEEANQPLFEFIEYTLKSLNNSNIPVNSFHLLFLVRLAEHLGFGPSGSLREEGNYFDLLTGSMLPLNPGHSYIISGETLSILTKMASMDYNDLSGFNAPRVVRLDLLERLIDFYKVHLPDLTELKSVKVLHEIMNQ